MGVCMCVCVRVCVFVRACVRACGRESKIDWNSCSATQRRVYFRAHLKMQRESLSHLNSQNVHKIDVRALCFMDQAVPDSKEKLSLLMCVCVCVCVCLYVKMLTVSSGSHKLWPPCCGISWGWRWSCHQSRALRWRGAVWAHNRA